MWMDEDLKAALLLGWCGLEFEALASARVGLRYWGECFY